MKGIIFWTCLNALMAAGAVGATFWGHLPAKAERGLIACDHGAATVNNITFRDITTNDENEAVRRIALALCARGA